MAEPALSWKKCSACKKDIAFKQKYYVCSVSTCNSQRTGYVFCSVGCFETHIPGARHKNAAAVEETSPATAAKPQRRIVSSAAKPSPLRKAQESNEILVIASRLKEFIRQQSEFNTSASVLNALSQHLRHVSLQAIDNARDDGRKTVMEQDFDFLKKVNYNI